MPQVCDTSISAKFGMFLLKHRQTCSINAMTPCCAYRLWHAFPAPRGNRSLEQETCGPQSNLQRTPCFAKEPGQQLTKIAIPRTCLLKKKKKSLFEPVHVLKKALPQPDRLPWWTFLFECSIQAVTQYAVYMLLYITPHQHSNELLIGSRQAAKSRLILQHFVFCY